MKKALLVFIGFVFISAALAGPALAAVLQVQQGFRDVTLRGYSRPITSATVAAEVSGVIITRYYDVGDTVTTQPLVQIDPTWIDLQLRENDTSRERTRIAIDQARSRTAWLEKEFVRRQTLVTQGRVSESSFDEIEQQRDQSRLDVRLQEQQLQQLEVQRQTLIEQQKRHRPTAPAGWLVSRRYIDAEDLVSAGTPLMDIGDYRQLLIPLSVSAEELAAIKQGSHAQLNDQTVSYHVHSVSPAFDEKTRKIAIELMIDDFSGEHRGGLPFELNVQIADDGFMVPVAAISDRYNHPQVIRVDQPQPIEITILNHQGDWVRIAPTDQLHSGVELRDQTPTGGSDKP
jgi:RND family efflux transporter MFP subunit